MDKIFFCVLVLGTWALPLGSAQAASPPFIPKYGKLLIIGEQQDSMNGYLRSIGIVPGGFMFYISIQNMDGLTGPADYGGGVNNAQYYLDRYPNTVVQLGLYMVGALEDTLEGKYDQNILKLGRWLQSIGRPVYLRIGYEFDLPDNNYDPDLYSQTYRYIVDYLRALGVNNVAYVWHSACRMESKEDPMDWYPGDDYVDWFAVSIFDPMQIGIAKKFFDSAAVHSKPLMIAESSAIGSSLTRTKMEWFKHYFDFINQENIKVVCYIDCDWNSYPLFKAQDWGDARLQKDPPIERRWIRQTNKGFLQSSSDLYDDLDGNYRDTLTSSEGGNAFSGE